MSANKKSIERTLKRLDAMTDEAIDYSDIPPLSSEMFAQALVQNLRLTPPRFPPVGIGCERSVSGSQK